MAKINSHTKSQTGIVAILFSYFRVGVIHPISRTKRQVAFPPSCWHLCAWNKDRDFPSDVKLSAALFLNSDSFISFTGNNVKTIVELPGLVFLKIGSLDFLLQ